MLHRLAGEGAREILLNTRSGNTTTLRLSAQLGFVRTKVGQDGKLIEMRRLL